MGLLEIQRLLSEKKVDRIVVDTAPSGHTLNLLRLEDFLDVILNSLELFQKKHQVITETLTGSYTLDEVDDFLADLKFQLAEGRRLLQDDKFTGCIVVAVSEPMCFAETERFITSLKTLNVPYGGIVINRIVSDSSIEPDRYAEQQNFINKFLKISENKPVFIVPQHQFAPLGGLALDNLAAQIQYIDHVELAAPPPIQWPT
ncbi:MAG: ArsA family ATPase, partial [Dolichospermum sp.]